MGSTVLQFAKCLNPDCCQPYCSPWLQLFPKRFIHAPVVLERSGNSIQLAKPGSLPANFTYTDPSHTRNLNMDLQNLPFDAYLPSAEGTLSMRTCPVCLMNFPSAAQMVDHRRARHKYTRKRLGSDFESTLFSQSTEIECVVARSHDGFTCILKNGYVSNRQLPESHSEVAKFLNSRNSKPNMPNMSLKEWAEIVPKKGTDPESFGVN